MSLEQERERRRGGHEYGQLWMLAAALLDRPKNCTELEEYFRIMGRRFGMFIGAWHTGLTESRRQKNDGGHPLSGQVRTGVNIMLERGWVQKEGDCYRLTDRGREEARKMLTDLERGGRLIKKASDPQTVSTVTMIVHFILAAVKLPAALLSGSVGLLNDALDTLMDGISSLFVFFGVRSGRERQVSYLLLLFMTVTGLYTLYEAVMSFFAEGGVSPDPLAAAAVGISAAFCGLLWLYQKAVGLKHSCIPLIAQSIDSRNHVIVAAGVGAGLVAAYFDFVLLDQMVGLAVAVLILKGAVELLIDLLRSEGGEEIDLSRYGFTRLQMHRRRQMMRWLLYAVDEGRISSRAEMRTEMQTATDFSRVASLRALGLDSAPGKEENIERAIEELFAGGFVEEMPLESGGSAERAGEGGAGGPKAVLTLTEKGEQELQQALSGERALADRGRAAGGKGAVIRGIMFFLRFTWSAALFAALYVGLRWLIGFLPPWELWAEAGPFAAAGAVDVRLPFSLNPLQGLFWIAGLLFFYRGRMLAHRSRHVLHPAREHERERPLYVVTEGPFAIRRHPMSTGFILIYLGMGLGLHSGYGLLLTALMAVLWGVSALWEEHRLVGWLPEEYRRYRRTVRRRLFPWWGWIGCAAAYAAGWAGLLW
jgi:protein-S-isoprenylcysteine O-methyltransferase Ste14/Co/Zn/Cd efflux system component